MAVESERTLLHVRGGGAITPSGPERIQQFHHDFAVRQEAEAHMTDRQQPPAGQFRKVQRRMCDEFELRLRKTVVVDRVVFERSVRPRRKRQVDRVQHQQPDLLCREVDVKTVADTGRRDGSGREAVRIDEALPLRAAEAVRCIGRFGLAVIGVVIVVPEREPDRQPAGAHRFGGERDFTLRLLSRPVAVAHGRPH